MPTRTSRPAENLLGKSAANLAREQQVSERRDDRQGHDDRGQQGEGLGVGQRLEQLALGGLHGEDRQEADDRRGHGRHHRAAHLDGRAVDDLQSVLLGVRLLQPAQDVLAEDDPHVHHGADGDGDARQGHDVGVDPEELHADEGHQHRQRQQPGDQQAAAQVHDHDDDHDDGDQDLFGQGRVAGCRGSR